MEIRNLSFGTISNKKKINKESGILIITIISDLNILAQIFEILFQRIPS